MVSPLFPSSPPSRDTHPFGVLGGISWFPSNPVRGVGVGNWGSDARKWGDPGKPHPISGN